jgi:hypothetical protein
MERLRSEGSFQVLLGHYFNTREKHAAIRTGQPDYAPAPQHGNTNHSQWQDARDDRAEMMSAKYEPQEGQDEKLHRLVS